MKHSLPIMDFSTLKTRLLEAKDIAIQKSQEAAEQAMHYGANAVSKTPLAIKTPEELDEALKNRKLAVIVGNEPTEGYRKLVALYPVLLTKVWVEGAQLRYCDSEKTPEIASRMHAAEYPSLSIFFEGVYIKTIAGEDAIKKYLDNMDFTPSTNTEANEPAKNPETPTTPNA